MLSGYDFSAMPSASSTTNTDFQSSPSAILDAKALKQLLRASGHKLSSNGFDALCNFVKQMTMALALGASRALRVGHVEPSLDPETLPWTAIIASVQEMLPSLESWFTNWYEQLVRHVESSHDGQLPSDIPCCPDIREATSLLSTSILCSDFRTALSSHGRLTINWYSMVSCCCTINEILQWVLGVAMKMMDARGVGTLKRADITSIIERAPIFTRLHPHLPNILATDNILNTQTFDQCPSTMMTPMHANGMITNFMMNTGNFDTDALGIQFDSPGRNGSGEEVMVEDNLASKKKELTVEELTKLVGERLKPASPFLSSVVPRPSEKPFSTKTRYIVCSDRKFSWIQVSEESDSAVFIQSTGVQTDGGEDSISTDHDEQRRKLQNEVDALKALVVKLLGTN